ncbi:response regulator [Balneatrix alpica]|uniref:Response regulator n=1 Tax=Balneatrix alpica TaxID=75684 RepID=A0ABV5ZHA3_9GAMM|nr:response regulator [Balneatrix alpica]
MQILLVEDDQKLASLISQYLSKHGFQVDCLHQGQEAVQLIPQRQPELVILDLMLPGLDGLSICREVRNRYNGKILVLTASEDDMDQVAALEMGADDYVNKPLHPRVLLARIRMLLRRVETSPSAMAEATPTSSKELRYGHLYLNHIQRLCQLGSDNIALTPGEFDLLWLLASHPEQTLSRDELVKQTRGIEYDGLDRSIDNKITSLRRKLGDNASLPQRLITVRGKGYLFVPDVWY